MLRPPEAASWTGISVFLRLGMLRELACELALRFWPATLPGGAMISAEQTLPEGLLGECGCGALNSVDYSRQKKSRQTLGKGFRRELGG